MAEQWAGLPYLDVLRPEPGWVTEQAILATYSADLVAVVAALLALAGLDDDRGSGSKVDFANAFEALCGKVHILVQPGQIAAPGRRVPIMAILDRFVREIEQSPGGVWHPKIALVKFSQAEDLDPGQGSQWRLWIGSRNLTRSLDWDVGLVLSSYTEEGQGQETKGIAELGTELARLAGPGVSESEQLRRELELVRWNSPKGVDVQDVRLLIPGRPRGLPPAPPHLSKLLVVSPFLDGTTIKRLAKWGEPHTQRRLLSTRTELGRLQAQAGRPLKDYSELLTLSAPDPEAIDAWSQGLPEATEPDSQDEQVLRGLHAKLIYAEGRSDRTLWLGSVNATTKGWDGPNAEVVAQLAIKDASVVEGLEEFVGFAEIVDPRSLSEVDAPNAEEQWLDEACRQVAERWQTRQERHARGPRLVSAVLPHPDREEIELRVGLLACDLVGWPRQQSTIQLPPTPLAQETELVHIRLGLGSLERNWLQRAPLDPPPADERDRQALARHLDPRTYLLWIRSLLGEQDIGDGGGDWDLERHEPRSWVGHSGPERWAPTLEEMLQAWSRDPSRLRSIDHKVRRYLRFMDSQLDDEKPAKDLEVLRDFEATWDMLCRVLVPEAA